MQQKRRKMWLLMACFCALTWIGNGIESIEYHPPKIQDPLKFLRGETDLNNIAKIKKKDDFNYKW